MEEPRRVVKAVKIVTHFKMHLDEYFALWLLIRFGGHLFKGIEDAEVAFYDGDGEIPTGDGIIAIGIGGGIFDEHAVGGREGKAGECCATLVAKHLDVKDGAAEKILKYVHRNDTSVGTDAFGLAYMVKLLHRRHPRGVKKVANWVNTALDALYDRFTEAIASPEKYFGDVMKKWLPEKSEGKINGARDVMAGYFKKYEEGKVTDYFSLGRLYDLLRVKYANAPRRVEEWLEMALAAKYEEQLAFFRGAAHDFGSATIEKIRVAGDKEVIVVSGESDDTAFNAYCRSVGFADVVVQRKSTGHILIFTKQERGKPVVSLREIAAVIRVMEQDKRRNIMTTDWNALRAVGHAEGAEMWYYHEAEMFLNGSETAKGLPPTALTLEEVRQAIKIGLDLNFFEEMRHHECRRGLCSSTRAWPCGFYDFGLRRCLSIRFKMRKEAMTAA